MSQDIKTESQRLSDHDDADHKTDSPLDPATPQHDSFRDTVHVALPTTEVPASPIDVNQSFRTEVNDDRIDATVIPSSLTPPPSTQVEPALNGNNARRTLSRSQQSNLASPPPTIMNILKGRDAATDLVLPEPQEILDATADELRPMLQNCVADHQRLKTETAHYRLQYNLLQLQANDDAARAEVELEMLRREVEALRSAEHTRQAKRELSTFSETLQIKYLEVQQLHLSALDDAENLRRKLKVATKVIQQKEEELISASDERDLLVTRIRENREHMHKLCSPGGLFHGAMTPKQSSGASPTHQRPSAYRQLPRGLTSESSHGISTLLEAISSQDNNSAPSTPLVPSRSVARPAARHHRNAQSLSSLPTTPINRPRAAGLLPSASLVALTEPPRPYGNSRYYEPATPTTSRADRRKSRESTISADGDDTEELARQALRMTQARRSFDLAAQTESARHNREDRESDVYDSQASQAATEMLRRDPRQSFEVRSSQESQDTGPVERSSATMQAKLLADLRTGADKRKFSESCGSSQDELRKEQHQAPQGSPSKKTKVNSPREIQPRLGLGIQYSQ